MIIINKIISECSGLEPRTDAPTRVRDSEPSGLGLRRGAAPAEPGRRIGRRIPAVVERSAASEQTKPFRDI